MKVGKYSTKPALRRQFKNADQIGDVINRSRAYVITRLKGPEVFTAREQRLILKAIGSEPTPENINFYFGG